MARSIRKGPYVAAKLEKKVEAMNDGKAKKAVVKHGAAEAPSRLILLVTLLLCTTETSASLCMEQNSWWATSSANSLQPGISKDTQARKDKTVPVSRSQKITIWKQ